MKAMLCALAGALAAVLITTTSALAGSGVGDVFNLGQTNTVNGTSVLTGYELRWAAAEGSELEYSKPRGSRPVGGRIRCCPLRAAHLGRRGRACTPRRLRLDRDRRVLHLRVAQSGGCSGELGRPARREQVDERERVRGLGLAGRRRDRRLWGELERTGCQRPSSGGPGVLGRHASSSGTAAAVEGDTASTNGSANRCAGPR